MVKTIKQLLAGTKRVGIDTSIFIYSLEDNKKYAPHTDALFDYLETSKRIEIKLSSILLTELFVHPYRKNDLILAQKWLEYFRLSKIIDVVPVSPQIALEASRLRAKYDLRTADSIHLASALLTGCTTFIGNDVRMKKLREKIDIIILDELL